VAGIVAAVLTISPSTGHAQSGERALLNHTGAPASGLTAARTGPVPAVDGAVALLGRSLTRPIPRPVRSGDFGLAADKPMDGATALMGRSTPVEARRLGVSANR